MNQLPVFPGMQRPSTDFDPIRSELRAWPMFREIDLSVSRSLAAGTHLILPIVGNVLYVDQKPNSGFATVNVQDDTRAGNTPITIFSGFLARVPFTQVIFQNDPQPGQFMRLIYGTDIEFLPGVGSGVSVLNAVNVNDIVDPVSQVIRADGALTVGSNQVTQILAPSANLRGFVLDRMDMTLQSAGGGGLIGQNVIAALSAPTVTNASRANAHLILAGFSSNAVSASFSTGFVKRRFPGGWGVWAINDVTVGAAAQALNLATVELL